MQQSILCRIPQTVSFTWVLQYIITVNMTTGWHSKWMLTGAQPPIFFGAICSLTFMSTDTYWHSLILLLTSTHSPALTHIRTHIHLHCLADAHIHTSTPAHCNWLSLTLTLTGTHSFMLTSLQPHQHSFPFVPMSNHTVCHSLTLSSTSIKSVWSEHESVCSWTGMLTYAYMTYKNWAIHGAHNKSQCKGYDREADAATSQEADVFYRNI